MKKVSVAVAQDSAVLEAVRAAKDRQIADAILVGDAFNAAGFCNFQCISNDIYLIFQSGIWDRRNLSRG